MKLPVLRSVIAASLLSLGLSALVSSGATHAQTGQALEIAPPVLNLQADPGETVQAEISLRDVSSGPLVVTSQVNDFVAGGEDGTPKILLNSDEPTPYSLRSWIDPLPRLTLEPQEIKTLPITIRVPANASPGGYFGVIRFTATPPELEGTGVSLSASLGALVLLTVNGEVKQDMSLVEFFVSKNDQAGSLFEATPVTFVERIKNNGNIHEQPAGQVTVTDMFGNQVATVNINLPPRNVLPDSIRRFEQPLDSSVLGNKILFGRYTADLVLTYGEGDDQKTITAQQHFWVIPYKLIGFGILGLIVLFFVLRTLLRRYNRHVIKQANKAKR